MIILSVTSLQGEQDTSALVPTLLVEETTSVDSNPSNIFGDTEGSLRESLEDANISQEADEFESVYVSSPLEQYESEGTRESTICQEEDRPNLQFSGTGCIDYICQGSYLVDGRPVKLVSVDRIIQGQKKRGRPKMFKPSSSKIILNSVKSTINVRLKKAETAKKRKKLSRRKPQFTFENIKASDPAEGQENELEKNKSLDNKQFERKPEESTLVPRKKRGRPFKTAILADNELTIKEEEGEPAEGQENELEENKSQVNKQLESKPEESTFVPRKKRGRPFKTPILADNELPIKEEEGEPAEGQENELEENKSQDNERLESKPEESTFVPRKKRGRPFKTPLLAGNEPTIKEEEGEPAEGQENELEENKSHDNKKLETKPEESTVVPRKKRGRPFKTPILADNQLTIKKEEEDRKRPLRIKIRPDILVLPDQQSVRHNKKLQEQRKKPKEENQTSDNLNTEGVNEVLVTDAADGEGKPNEMSNIYLSVSTMELKDDKQVFNKRKRRFKKGIKPPFKCGQCSRSYFYLRGLRQHQKLECNVPPQFPCPFCPQQFRYRQVIREHVKHVHPLAYPKWYNLHFIQPTLRQYANQE